MATAAGPSSLQLQQGGSEGGDSMEEVEVESSGEEEGSYSGASEPEELGEGEEEEEGQYFASRVRD